MMSCGGRAGRRAPSESAHQAAACTAARAAARRGGAPAHPPRPCARATQSASARRRSVVAAAAGQRRLQIQGSAVAANRARTRTTRMRPLRRSGLWHAWRARQHAARRAAARASSPRRRQVAGWACRMVAPSRSSLPALTSASTAAHAGGVASAHGLLLRQRWRVHASPQRGPEDAHQASGAASTPSVRAQAAWRASVSVRAQHTRRARARGEGERRACACCAPAALSPQSDAMAATSAPGRCARRVRWAPSRRRVGSAARKSNANSALNLR